MSDPLPSEIAAALGASHADLGPFADVRYFAEVDSTNDHALALASAGAQEGTSVIAGRQRAGRGRRGHSWFSPAGAGVYLSVVVRPESAGGAARALSLVTIAAGVAAAAAVARTTGLPIELKWPNDLVVGRPWRKLGGLLCESVTSGSRVEAVVVGMGINLHAAAYPPELAARATSIEGELGRPPDRAATIVACLVELGRVMADLRAGRGDSVLAAWRRFGRAGLGAAPVRWRDRDVPRAGLARDLDADGALLVEYDGRLERIVAGDVTWERLSHDA